MEVQNLGLHDTSYNDLKINLEILRKSSRCVVVYVFDASVLSRGENGRQGHVFRSVFQYSINCKIKSPVHLQFLCK